MAGVVAVPLLLRGLGDAGLGVFTLAVGLIGFSGVFDLGLSRALTHSVASELGRGESADALSPLVRKALSILFALGGLWAVLLWVLVPVLVDRVFEFDAYLRNDAVAGLRWVAVSLPAALVSAGLVGCLEGFQRFAAVNVVRISFGTAAFLVPGVVAVMTRRLDLALASLAAVRIIAIVPWLLIASSHVIFRTGGPDAKGVVRRLVRFGAWLTVTNIVGPLMVFADRFYLASLFPPSVVALYTVPLDAVSRFGTLPMVAVNAAFPELAKRMGAHLTSVGLVRSVSMAMTVVWFPFVAVLLLLAEDLLTLWLNPSMGIEARGIASWLLVGVFLNGFAHIPYAVLQSAGRSDLTAKLHLLEFPVYAFLLVVGVEHFGLIGAAAAWCGRMAIDTLLLFGVAERLASDCRSVLRDACLRVVFGTTLLTAAVTVTSPTLRWVLAVSVMVLFLGVIMNVRAGGRLGCFKEDEHF